jgi:hypothetical protein
VGVHALQRRLKDQHSPEGLGRSRGPFLFPLAFLQVFTVEYRNRVREWLIDRARNSVALLLGESEGVHEDAALIEEVLGELVLD